MSTGGNRTYIGTRYSHYNVKRNVQFCGTPMPSWGKSTVVVTITKSFPPVDVPVDVLGKKTKKQKTKQTTTKKKELLCF